jgi:hypothetical protein
VAAAAFSSATPIAVSIADGTSVTALITAGTAPTALTGEVASVIPVDTAIFVAAIPMSSDAVEMAAVVLMPRAAVRSGSAANVRRRRLTSIAELSDSGFDYDVNASDYP